MKFAQNQGKKPEFSDVFNQIAWKIFDEQRFYAEAEKAGYAEARVFRPGQSMMFVSKVEDRITAQISESGRLRRYMPG